MITGPSLCCGPGPPCPLAVAQTGGYARAAASQWESPSGSSHSCVARPHRYRLPPHRGRRSICRHCRPLRRCGPTLPPAYAPTLSLPSAPPFAAAAAYGIPAGTRPAVATHASAAIAPQCSPTATGPPPRLTIEAAPPVARAGGSIPCGARARRSLPRRTIARIFRSREAEGARPLHRMGGGARVANRGKIPC